MAQLPPGSGRIAARTGGILSYFTRHRTAANLLMVVMLAVGLYGASQIRSQYFPDVVIESVTVSVQWSGAGAEDVDRAIVQVLEPSLLAIEGVVASSSRATEGAARIELEFEPGTDIGRAAEDVQTAVDLASDLPEGADDPTVRRDAWRDRVTDVVISGPVALDQLGRFADEFVGRLFAEGVTRSTITGFAAPQTVVEVPSANMIRHDVTMAQIADAIAAEVSAAPAGDVSDGTARVRTGQAKRSVDDIAGIVLRSGADGSVLTIGDVARVRTDGADRVRAAYVGTDPAVTIRVDRNDQGDSIDLQASVQKVADEMQLSLPAGVTAELVRTRAEQISGQLSLLVDDAIVGLLLVVGFLFLFLNARTAIWVASGIPIAMLAAVAIMWIGGQTLNVMSLFALFITLGILVDDAIVVSEYGDFRARTYGESPVVAAESAAIRMAGPVFASTVVMVIAFFGLVVIGGSFGSLIAAIPFTVIAVLLASLVECFLILPNHIAHALAGAGQRRWYDEPSRVVNLGLAWFSRKVFRPMIAGVVWARYPVLAGAVLLLFWQAAYFVRGDLQWRFFNSPEQGSVTGNFSMLPGATRDDTIAMMRELQRAATALGARLEAEHGVNPITFAIAEVGGNSGRALAGSDTKDADLLGAISLELISTDDRPYSSFEFVSQLQEEVRPHPQMEELSFRGWRSGPGGDSLSIDLAGAEAAELKAAAEALKTALVPFPEVSALEDNLAYDKEELILTLTPQGQALGFAIDDLGALLRDRLNGIEAASFPDGPRSATIRVELPPGELTADFLDRTLMPTASGDHVPLADIVQVTRQSGFSTVRRENGLRLVTVSGDLAEDDPARAAEVQRQLREEILPRIEEDHGVTTRLSGLAEQEQEFLGDAALGFGMALVGIFLVLAWVFSSWTRPLVVMSVIPFGLVGAIYGHVVWEVPLSMFSIIGLIGMSGIIVNDSIVLVDTVDEYSAERGLFPAIIDGTADRLRAVMLTTLTTVLGLAPLLFERSSQAEFLKPTVITLAYGLGFGMVLVLLVVPALLAAQMDVARAVAGFRRALRGPRGLRALVGAAAAAVAALFAATLGAVMVTGALPDWLPGQGMAGALALFVAGAGAIALVAWVVGALSLRRV